MGLLHRWSALTQEVRLTHHTAFAPKKCEEFFIRLVAFRSPYACNLDRFTDYTSGSAKGVYLMTMKIRGSTVRSYPRFADAKYTHNV